LGLILDTSALIGWVERGNPKVEELIVQQGDPPFVHHVTLGELQTGVARAVIDGLSSVVIDARRRTLAVAEMCEIVGFGDPGVFGAIAAEMSRKVSHNDMWIAATAIERGETLLTEDRALHGAVADRTWAALPGWRANCMYVGPIVAQ
jgi:predicted nucleic acid-binding protein